MLKSVKRSYDSMSDATPMVTTSCSPHKIQFLESPLKRNRNNDSPATSPTTLQRPSSFPTQPTVDPNTLLEKNLPKKPKSIGNEIVYTESEVRSIVEKAVADREAALRSEYDRILQELLQDQYRNFAKFHEDYVSRSVKESDFSYMN
eukprot:TRINITY_DN6129_c0_g1_i1.p1 TRINITY_DN6129_c0_g1~~TRINITY_DN6129_c0_g1_i1.p1  ORF type:complete len:169 (+),score=25.30 TRINITY_DN6129_c0_g1_i1:67-507(+)